MAERATVLSNLGRAGQHGKAGAAAVLASGMAALVFGAATLTPVAPASAQANACAAACYGQHNQCRMSTKGSPSCDAALTQCLRSCAGKK